MRYVDKGRENLASCCSLPCWWCKHNGHLRCCEQRPAPWVSIRSPRTTNEAGLGDAAVNATPLCEHIEDLDLSLGAGGDLAFSTVRFSSTTRKVAGLSNF